MKFLKTILTLLVVIITLNSFAQSKVTGIIVDQQNTPILGATIMLKNLENTLAQLTDSDGKFEVKAPQGIYTIEIRYLGFQSYKSTIEIIKDEEKDIGTISLLEGTEQLQSVEILGRIRKDYNSDYSFSATKVAIKNKELPQAVATVTKELIDDRLAFQLPDAVKTVSGVSATGLYNLVV